MIDVLTRVRYVINLFLVFREISRKLRSKLLLFVNSRLITFYVKFQSTILKIID